jgi:hypothetical protein
MKESKAHNPDGSSSKIHGHNLKNACVILSNDVVFTHQYIAMSIDLDSDIRIAIILFLRALADV